MDGRWDDTVFTGIELCLCGAVCQTPRFKYNCAALHLGGSTTLAGMLGPARPAPHSADGSHSLPDRAACGFTAGAGKCCGVCGKPEARHGRVRRRRYWSSSSRRWVGCKAPPRVCRGGKLWHFRVGICSVGGSFGRRAPIGGPATGGNPLRQAWGPCRSRRRYDLWPAGPVSVGSGASWCWPEPAADSPGGMSAHTVTAEIGRRQPHQPRLSLRLLLPCPSPFRCNFYC